MYDIVKNPIPKSGLWVTPDSMNELYDMVEQYTGAERALAMHIMMLTLNACNKSVEDNILSKEVFAQ
jgi:hypothetical protein